MIDNKKRMSRLRLNHLGSESGVALILTLMILVIITAVVVEFAYGVYTATSSLYNLRDSQRLSLAAKSGISLAVKTISDLQSISTYTYPGSMEIPVENILGGFNGSVVVKVEDETSRFNLNAIVNTNGTLNDAVFESFKRLLKLLEVDEGIADRIADWIDKDSEPRLRDSEDGAKNGYIDSVDELLLIKGIDQKTYEKILPYVTVYGVQDHISININTASIPVIMCIDASITKDAAERIVRAREFKPFTGTDDPNFTNAAGTQKTLFMGKIGVKSSLFRITSVAEENRIKSIIEGVAEINGADAAVRYWKEI